MIEIEKRRSGKDLSRSDAPMNFADGSRIMNAAVQVMKTLGWAWRWAEWWVDYNSSWEPLLEPGQKESRMTKEELKIVDSTRESRCEDARRCRLAAFGAALRNRDYDTADGFDREAFDKAIRAILHTESLVGPLEESEINFFAEWLGRAYRSKSRLLGFGEFKIKVADRLSSFVHHLNDQSPKYVLGSRPLPGRGELQKDGIFEAGVDEVDDFMTRDLVVIPPPKPRHQPSVPLSEEDRKKRRRERDRARRERDRLIREAERASSSAVEPARKKGRAASRQSLSAEETENEGTLASDRSTAVKRRGRPSRDRSLVNLPTTTRESSRTERRPGRPRRSTHSLEHSSGSVETLSRVAARRKRRDRSTAESELDDEDYRDELAPPPPKRKPGRPPRNAGKPTTGRTRTDRRKTLYVPDTSDEVNQDAAAHADSVTYLPPVEAGQDESESLSKFDLVKSRRRQTRRTMNVGARLASKSYDDAPTRPIAVKRAQPKDNEDDKLSISMLVSKRKKLLPWLPLSPPAEEGGSNSKNDGTVGDGSLEQNHEQTPDKPEASAEDTPQKRGRRRGKQQAVDQLSLTLNQLRPRHPPR